MVIHPLLRLLAAPGDGRPRTTGAYRPSLDTHFSSFHFPLFSASLLPVSSSLFMLAVPMRRCLGKHSCMSSTFSIAMLNGTCFLRSPGIDFVFGWEVLLDLYTLIIIIFNSLYFRAQVFGFHISLVILNESCSLAPRKRRRDLEAEC